MSFPRSAPALMLALALSPLPAFAQMNMPGMEMPDARPATPVKAPDPMPGMETAPAKPGWTVMSHGVLTLVADDQQGPRGDSKAFVEGMVMVMADRNLSDRDDLRIDAMLSPDAFTGRSGYPLLLQTGETADGVTTLIDRQHPHDLLMGLTARLTHRFNTGSAFVEAGYPGAFAFGPTAFMHRASGDNFPTAPISHHWLDSGHITMGEVTAGISRGPLTLEVSEFTGREPDENRFDLDPVHLDSTAVRVTWRVMPDLSAQTSWARQVSPEALEPGVNLIKHSLSVDYGHSFGAGTLNSTLAWGRKRVEHGTEKPSDAWLFENTWHFNGPWIALARYEHVYNDELAARAAWVSKAEAGIVRTFAIRKNISLGVGVVRQFNDVPGALKAAYGGHPNGTVAFIQLKFHGGGMGGMAM